MRLLVCGSRAWFSEAQYHRVADEILALKPSLVMHGGAKGADECADMFCNTPPTIPVLVFRADWERDGKAAGPIRNARMLRDGKPTHGLAFGALWKRNKQIDPPYVSLIGDEPKWRATGTGDMMRRMLAARLPVRWVPAPGAAAVELTEMPPPPYAFPDEQGASREALYGKRSVR